MKDIILTAKKRWDAIAKPIESLGLMETNVARLCGMYGDASRLEIDKRALVVMCGDHGVVAEGVTQTTSDVTNVVANNFALGKSTVNQMANCANVDVYTVDIGMDTPNTGNADVELHTVIDRKIKRGTDNLAVADAMTIEECKAAIKVGEDMVGELKARGYKLVATGEMGIGNTTPTSVLAAIFLNKTAEEVTGLGAGLSKEGYEIKKQVVARAVQRVKDKNVTNPLEILAMVGGLEIAGMVGLFLGGLKHKMPIIIDGAISSISALTAARIDENAKDYMLASHASEEITGTLSLKELGLEPMIHGKMRLGEGTGAMALIPLLDMAVAVYNNMGTFENYNIEAYERFEN